MAEVKMKFTVTKTWPSQSLRPVCTEYATMASALVAMVDEATRAIQSRRVFDAVWRTDDEMELLSPTGRVLERYVLTSEEP